MRGYMQIFMCKIPVKNLTFTRCRVAPDVEHHQMWSTTRCGVPQDMKCHEMHHVHGDQSRLGLWLSTNKSITIAYFLLATLI